MQGVIIIFINYLLGEYNFNASNINPIDAKAIMNIAVNWSN